MACRSMTASKYLRRTIRLWKLLKTRGALLHEEKIQHSYPHCWRCHNPIIFPRDRAVVHRHGNADGPEKTTTAKRCARGTLDEIKKVKWDPAWGEDRIANMIATRPDWCISRLANLGHADCRVLVRRMRGVGEEP